ncbi:MAG: hypothetical protein Q9M91_07040 [Candidatus Dojkabacteria bacterium]|nr:hypothetical protein [Candidatus Dojkabacteria bacterium]MDQ7021547.1 hypothetical protein [Candidatus Dojkabacteria bacterium]
MPVYRFLNNKYGTIHFYVTGEENMMSVIMNSREGGIWDNAFTYETVAFCVYESTNEDSTAVYRFRHNALGGSVHFYVVGDTNKQRVITNSQEGGKWEGVFTYETVAFYTPDADLKSKLDFKNLGTSFETSLGIKNSSDNSFLCKNKIKSGLSYQEIFFLEKGVVVAEVNCVSKKDMLTLLSTINSDIKENYDTFSNSGDKFSSLVASSDTFFEGRTGVLSYYYTSSVDTTSNETYYDFVLVSWSGIDMSLEEGEVAVKNIVESMTVDFSQRPPIVQ